MKKFLVYVVLFSTGCNQINQNSEPKSPILINSAKINSAHITIPTTALPVEALEELPSGFVLDSIFSADTVFNYSTTIFFPKSNENDKLNKSIRQFIEQQINLEKPGTTENDGTSFQMWVIDFKVSERLVYCLFRQQSFTNGAAHFNHSFLTLNYDLRKGKRVSFTDVFKFSKTATKQSFCNKVNGYVNEIDESDGYNDGLSPNDIGVDLNYSIIGQQLTVYPNYCCADEDKVFKVNLQLIHDYIDPILAKEYPLTIPK